MVIVCCVCQKTKTAEDRWGHQKDVNNEILSHGYCPECAENLMKEIEQYRKVIKAAV